MTLLHVFDMDGTLLTGTTANLQIAHQTGTLHELTALEADFAAGLIDTVGFSTRIHRLWGDLTPDHVAAAYRAGTWLTGIAEVCADIRARGEHSAVITMSPDFFARHLLDLGFDDVLASRFPPPPFTTALDTAGILTPADKVRLTDALAARHGLPGDRCIAYGDSMSDAPLFRHLPHTVAVNADHHLADLASLHYTGTDLTAAYRLARTLITAP
ncbi:HAD family hydrolase [Actinomadura parmotrematis]|uniref:HAD-IB family phosphatase n=1 Tax=Actinomadura parmotrematis TaxID=2864039 RepID=A0ABS7G5B5_9ACTN|nr:HAD-IB family phosphatase [Actinomadura parmotrematis]MBW8487726.1 HAD-IB family phosphatase [Actinomadura parmotrematis]